MVQKEKDLEMEMEMEMESFIRRKPLLTLHVYDTHVACTDHACAVVILGLCHSCGRQLLGQIEQETKVCMEGGQSKKKERGGGGRRGQSNKNNKEQPKNPHLSYSVSSDALGSMTVFAGVCRSH